MSDNQTDPKVINASPSKGLFIYMLVKDIPLIQAIIDLVDNSVDGAQRLRQNENNDNKKGYAGLRVDIDISKNQFKITDNCGGIPVELARDYAFRFGRPEDMELIPGSVGRFGIGMKRAFFKLGRKFRVESTTENSHFVVEEDVEEWKKNLTTWTFEFKELHEDLEKISQEPGTTVTITALHDSVSATFSLDNFKTRLIQQIESAHLFRMNLGLAIIVDGIPLQIRQLKFLNSDHLRPAYRKKVFNESAPPITVEMYSGVSESKPSEAGWYVFCNGRMLLEAEQTITTGWGEGGENTIPKYHNQYARFRGYAFFNSEDAGRLPWNTTKTGVDSDSPIYQSERNEMLKLMRPVIDFLNKLDAEKNEGLDEKPLISLVKAAKPTKLPEVRSANIFTTLKLPIKPPPGPPTGRISYSKPVNQIERAKETLKVKTLREVGEKTFDYFFQMECED